MATGLVATALSGAPSTTWALLRGNDPLRAARAAGALVPGRAGRPGVAAGAVAHVAISALWTVALACLDRRWPLGPGRGAVAGLAIAALDLELVGRRVPAIAALPQAPQWADHAAFGALVGAGLRRRRGSAHPTGRSPTTRRRRPGR